jgi:hypothetical protein
LCCAVLCCVPRWSSGGIPIFHPWLQRIPTGLPPLRVVSSVEEEMAARGQTPEIHAGIGAADPQLGFWGTLAGMLADIYMVCHASPGLSMH